MTGADTVVRIDGLVKHYGKVEAVRGIDLQIRRGEVVDGMTSIQILCGKLRLRQN